MSRISLVCLAVFAACLASSPTMAAPIQTTGHADIRFLYDAAAGTADIAYYLDQGSTVDGQEISAANPVGGTPVTIPGGGGQVTKIVFQPSELITFVPDPPIIIPDELEAMLAFTGAQAGDPLWNIPLSQEEDRPWTGLSTESVSSADFSNIRYQLTAFSGPGQMSLLTWGAFGDPSVKMQTSNGLSSEDAIDLLAHTHSHYEWFFTAPGAYAFELTAIGTRTPAAGGGTVSASETFTFHVAVPEPGVAALLATAAPAGVMLCRSRSSRSAKIAT
jgi:surface-anchored protein